ncbi:MAG: methylated-DNA--[protein]-cysteine S-methyltransferase [Verrucomicrobiales bacterium]
MKQVKGEQTATHRIESPFGAFEATFTGKGLAALKFPHQQEGSPEAVAVVPTGNADELGLRTQAALLAILNGEKPGQLPPLDLHGTDFQRAVWQTLAAIPQGQTMTYGEIARAIGRPKAFRAVGQACGANPIPVLIPCHRALAANKKIGGFSGGIEWKEKLLSIEHCSFRKPAVSAEA